MSNQNDNSAFIYDQIYAYYLDPQLTAAEIELIKSLVNSPAKILDVGAGTGRHAVPLAEAGNIVTAIDESAKMLAELKSKSNLVETINADFFKHDFGATKFSLAISMFNAFNEFVFDEQTATNFFSKLNSILEVGGKVLLNISDPKTFDAKTSEFTNTHSEGERIYKLTWKSIEYNPETKTSISNEKIEIFDLNNKKLNEINSQFKQRWWTESEITAIAKKTGFQFSLNRISLNTDYYFILTKND